MGDGRLPEEAQCGNPPVGYHRRCHFFAKQAEEYKAILKTSGFAESGIADDIQLADFHIELLQEAVITHPVGQGIVRSR